MTSTGGVARRPQNPAARTTTARRAPAATSARRKPTQPDPVVAALEVWTSVVSGLESARYAEVGTEYAKLSALLAQQRTAQLLGGGTPGPEWHELARTAQRALDLLEPLLGAARLLATLPSTPVPAVVPPPRRAPSAPRTARKAAPRR